MKVLVTGAAGFVGSSLSAVLANQGHEVFGIDNFSEYYSPELKQARVENLLKPHQVEFERIDLLDEESLNSIFVVGFAPVFAWLWIKLGKYEPSSPYKMAAGLMLLAYSNTSSTNS